MAEMVVGGAGLLRPAPQNPMIENIRANSMREPACNLRDLTDAADGRPCFLFGGGPSLENAIPPIRRALDAGFDPLMVAVDRAAKPLHAGGIRPQVICSLDYQEITQWHCKGLHLHDTILIANTSVHPSVPRLFPDVVWYNVAPVLGRPLEPSKAESYRLFPRVDTLNFSPGLVGGEALAVSVWFKPSRIVLCGYDCGGEPKRDQVLANLARWIEMMVPVLGCPVWNTSKIRTIQRGVRCLSIQAALLECGAPLVAGG